MYTLRHSSPNSEAAAVLKPALSMINRIDIAALQQGNQSAFREIVAAFQDKVYNTCLGFLECPQEAEDAAQEVFIEVFRSVGNFRGDASLSTWIYRIAVSKCLQEIRKKRRQKRFAHFVPRIHGEEEPSDCVGDPDVRNQPLAQLEDKERADILYAALSALAESQRVAFTLHKIEGLSYHEIAEVMDASLPAVESLIHRAKTNLRKRLTEYYRMQLS
jgi:RNA polymerase sigma factor (sigma-70 family)